MTILFVSAITLAISAIWCYLIASEHEENNNNDDIEFP